MRDKRLDIAKIVGVFSEEEQQREQVRQAEEHHIRAGENLMAVTFGVVVGTGLIWTHMVGLW